MVRLLDWKLKHLTQQPFKSESTTVNRKVFQRIYNQSVEDVMHYWTIPMQREISAHNVCWSPERFDFKDYLLHSELRYWLALREIISKQSFTSWCDIGGFFGAFPLTLNRLGINVAMTEALKFYSEAFSPLFSFLLSEGIEIIDHDPFDVYPLSNYSFDVVSSMAVLEHYPHSLKMFFDNIKHIISPPGLFYIDVPNIAYWPKRLALLAGHSPLTPADDIYHSHVPFTGHHHEYTLHELKAVASLSHYQVINHQYFNYSFTGPFIKRLLSDPLLTLTSFKPSMRECFSLLLRPIP